MSNLLCLKLYSYKYLAIPFHSYMGKGGMGRGGKVNVGRGSEATEGGGKTE
jgi:hypothetical protein